MVQNVRSGITLKTVMVHVFFWMLSLVLFSVLIFLTRGFRLQAMDFHTALNIVITLVFICISVYINLLILLPFFFEKKKYVFFALLEIANIGLFITLNYFFSMAMEGKHPAFLNEMIAEFVLVLVFLVISTLMKFTRDSIALQDANLRIKEIERGKVETELRALKAQINPHFFFNTLNSIYALSLDRSEKTPEVILKLSELMRYILYETRDDFVSMQRQIDFIRNYISLEQLRNDDKISINMDIRGANLEVLVAPLLFVPFIENAFKHVAKEKDNQSFIRILFDLTGRDRIFFTVANTKYNTLGEPASRGTGIGLANVMKRLDLLYPSKHELQINDSGKVFEVKLTLLLS